MPKDSGLASNATVIGALTLVSRLLGMARESVAAAAFGAGGIWAAFTVAFTIPNLFRKLFGEGALSAAFIPLYSQAVSAETQNPAGQTGLSSREFALASVNLLCAILIVLTVVGEAVLGVLWLVLTRADHLLAVQLTAIMLPYVLLVCGTAFLGAILQVHGRFAAVAATSIVLNAVLIAAIVLGGRLYDFTTDAGQIKGVFLIAAAVLVAGAVQVAMLAPSLHAIGFRFRLVFHVLTPEVRKMLQLTFPVALSAGVLQIGVMLDKAIAFSLAEGGGASTFTLFGTAIAYPMAEGAAVRLNWAQFLYQFPLGVFAISLATAIFPRLAGNALDLDKTVFRTVLRKGIVASLFIGIPASVGMIAVADPAVRLLFQHGKTTALDANWIILSTCIYSAAIWAFSLQQILSRAYYALHDTRTPLVWAVLNLLINLVVEIPLIFTPLREGGIAVGTFVSFALQSVVMTWMLSRRVGGIGLRADLKPLIVMIAASLAMGVVCWGIGKLFPDSPSKTIWALKLAVLIPAGAATYAVLCHLGGIDLLAHIRRRKPR